MRNCRKKWVKCGCLMFFLLVYSITVNFIHGQNKIDSVRIDYIDSLKKIKIETSYSSGIKSFEKFFFKNYLIQYKSYYPNGGLKTLKNFDIQEKELGTQLEYFENGRIKSESFITGQSKIKKNLNGKVIIVIANDGVYRTYFENGNLESEETYSKGIKKGLSIQYKTDGRIKECIYY